MATASHAAPTPAPLSRDDKAIAGVVAVLYAIGMPIGYLSGDSEPVALIVVTVVNVVFAAFLLLRFVPRQRAAGRPERAALVLAIVALVLCVVFWTGLPFSVGAAAIALAAGLRRAGATDRRATAALAIGALAVVLAFVALLVG